MPLTPPASRRVVAVSALLSTAALTAACGTATNSSSNSATATPSATMPTATSPATTAPLPSPSPATATATSACASSGLSAKVDTHEASGAAGSVYYPIDLTNTSGSPCTLYGYPGVSFVTGKGGSQIGSPATRNPAFKASTVTLAPGGVAHAILQVAEAGNYDAATCRPAAAHWLKVYPPGQTAPLYARLAAQVCSAPLPMSTGSQLSVYVVRSGPGTGNP